MPRRRPPHRELALDSSHWRRDGQPKVRYDTRADAIFAADERSAESGAELNVYLCPYCGGWHMGSRD
jgi:hypothetical protein